MSKQPLFHPVNYQKLIKSKILQLQKRMKKNQFNQLSCFSAFNLLNFRRILICFKIFRNISDFYNFMGNIVDRIVANKLETLLLSVIAASGYLLYKEHQKNDDLRQIISKALTSKSQGINQFENALNQVYLKEHVQHFSIRNNAEYPIYKIAITGGPCGGKSSSLRRIQEDLTTKGFRVFSVPEVPTLVVQAGGMILMSKFNIQQRIKFQSLLIRFQMYAEDYFTRLAEMSKSPSIVLCDRGTVDPAAYVSKQEFQAIMDQEGWSLVTLRDRRYDRVIFLSSAANGAEEFYTLQNNAARHEGLDLARNLDKKTLQAWTGHPHLTICPNVNGESFEQKIDRALRAVHKTVGLQMKNNRYEKFLIQKPELPFDLKVEICDIEEIFLVKDDQRWSEDKLKKRGQNNSFTYQRKYRSKQNQDGDFLQEIRKPLTSLQYVTLREQKADPKYKVVNRQRFTFVYNDLPYTVDVYDNLYERPKTYILRFANLQGVEGITLVPNFLKIERQVRQDKNYSLRTIAQIK